MTSYLITLPLFFLASEPNFPQVATRALDQWDIDYFALNTNQLHEDWRLVNKAHLWVHLPKAPGEEDKSAWINIYHVAVDKHDAVFRSKVRHATGRAGGISCSLLYFDRRRLSLFPWQERSTKVKLNPKRGGWVNIDLWDLVSYWFKNPNLNMGLVIEVSTNTGTVLKVGVKHQPSQVSSGQTRRRDRGPHFVSRFRPHFYSWTSRTRPSTTGWSGRRTWPAPRRLTPARNTAACGPSSWTLRRNLAGSGSSTHPNTRPTSAQGTAHWV